MTHFASLSGRRDARGGASEIRRAEDDGTSREDTSRAGRPPAAEEARLPRLGRVRGNGRAPDGDLCRAARPWAHDAARAFEEAAGRFRPLTPGEEQSLVSRRDRARERWYEALTESLFAQGRILLLYEGVQSGALPATAVFLGRGREKAAGLEERLGELLPALRAAALTGRALSHERVRTVGEGRGSDVAEKALRERVRRTAELFGRLPLSDHSLRAVEADLSRLASRATDLEDRAARTPGRAAKKLRALEEALGEGPGALRDRLARARDAGLEYGRAKRELLERNLLLVVWAVRTFFPETPESLRADAYHAGVIGLTRAVEKFEPAFGTKFSTYATWGIRNEVSRLGRQAAGAVHVPEHAAKYRGDIQRYVADYQAEHDGKEPSLGEVATHTGLRLAELRKMWDGLMSPTVSLDGPLTGDEEPGFDARLRGREPGPLERTWTAEQRRAIHEALRALDPREVLVVSLRFGLGIERDGEGRMSFNREAYGKAHTLEEVGKVLGLTKERVRQAEGGALKKLSQPGNPFMAGLGAVRRDLLDPWACDNSLPKGYWRHSDEGDRRLGLSLAELGLEMRIANRLEREGIHTLGDLTRTSREELLQIPEFSKTSLARVEELMGKAGEHLAEDPGGE